MTNFLNEPIYTRTATATANAPHLIQAISVTPISTNRPSHDIGLPLSPRYEYAPGLCLRSRIETIVANVFGVARGELRLATRGRAKVAHARQVAMYLAHVVYGLSLTEVGRVFDRDRTTVAHACTIVEDHRDDPRFDRVLENIERIILVWPARYPLP